VAPSDAVRIAFAVSTINFHAEPPTPARRLDALSAFSSILLFQETRFSSNCFARRPPGSWPFFPLFGRPPVVKALKVWFPLAQVVTPQFGCLRDGFIDLLLRAVPFFSTSS